MGQIDPLRGKAGLKIIRCSEPAGESWNDYSSIDPKAGGF